MGRGLNQSTLTLMKSYLASLTREWVWFTLPQGTVPDRLELKSIFLWFAFD